MNIEAGLAVMASCDQVVGVIGSCESAVQPNLLAQGLQIVLI